MPLTIRLRQQGRNNYRVFRLVVTDSRKPRDGQYIEMLGSYDPSSPKEETILSVKADRVAHWLSLGAQPSDRAKALIAKAAPEVIKSYTDQKQAHRVKMAKKRRDARRAKSAKK